MQANQDQRTEQEAQKPKWLIEIQNNSWNPELLISGLSLVFLFSISNEISELSIWMIQRLAFNPILIYFASIYISLALTSLKWTFAVHLVLRGLWIGWVGLNYVFPQGIVFDKLPKNSQKDFVKKEIGNPLERILLLERVCSSIFGFAFTMVGLSLFILTFFLIAFILELAGLETKYTLMIIGVCFFSISWILPINNFLTKRRNVKEIKFLRKYYVFTSRIFGVLFFRESLMTYQTNLSKVQYYVVLMSISIIFGLLSSTNIVNTAKFMRFALTESSILSYSDNKAKDEDNLFNNYYTDRNIENFRVQKASIPSFYIEEDYLEIFVANYRWDEYVFEEIMKTDTLNFKIDAIMNMKIDGVPLKADWYDAIHPNSDQRGWLAHVKIDHLSNDKHQLTIDKWLWNHELRKAQLEKNYCEIPFIKLD